MDTIAVEELREVYLNIHNVIWSCLSRYYPQTYFSTYYVNAMVVKIHTKQQEWGKRIKTQLKDIATEAFAGEGFPVIREMAKGLNKPDVKWHEVLSVLYICTQYARHCVERKETFTIKYIIYELEKAMVDSLSNKG